jgi:hypothetical protein
MNKVEWEIIDHGDFGSIKLGMTKLEINTILGEAFTRTNTPYTGMVRDIYGKKNVIIDYFEQNSEFRASYIEVSYPIKVRFLGEDLMRMPFSSAKELLKKNGIVIEKIETRPLLWQNVCLLKGLGLNSANETSNHLFSIYMFEDCYYERTEKLWQEYKKDISQRTENLFREFGLKLPIC